MSSEAFPWAPSPTRAGAIIDAHGEDVASMTWYGSDDESREWAEWVCAAANERALRDNLKEVDDTDGFDRFATGFLPQPTPEPERNDAMIRREIQFQNAPKAVVTGPVHDEAASSVVLRVGPTGNAHGIELELTRSEASALGKLLCAAALD